MSRKTVKRQHLHKGCIYKSDWQNLCDFIGKLALAVLAVGLHRIVGGSTGPEYGLFHSHWQEKIEVAKTTHLSSGISAAI